MVTIDPDAARCLIRECAGPLELVTLGAVTGRREHRAVCRCATCGQPHRLMMRLALVRELS